MKKQAGFILLCILSANIALGGENYNRFLEAYRNKNYSQALGYIAQAYQEDPNQDYLIYWYGVCLHLNKRYVQSGDILSRLPESYPFYPAQWYRSDAYLKAGQTNKAVTVVEKVLSGSDDADRNQRHFHNTLSGILIREGNLRKIEAYEPSFRAYAGKITDATFEYTYYLWGKFYLDNAVKSAKNNDCQAAADFLTRAGEYRELSGKTYAVYLDLVTVGSALLETKHYKEALSFLEKMPADERPLELAWNLSECYMNLGQTNRAAQALLKGLENPSDTAWKTAVYYSLLRAAISSQDAPDMLKKEKEIIGHLEKTKDANVDWAKYAICTLYKKTGEEAFVSGREKDAVEWLSQALRVSEKGMGMFDEYLNRNDLTILRDAMAYWRDNYARLKDKAIIHQAQILVFTDMDAVWTDKKGNQHRVKGHSEPGITNVLAATLKLWDCVYFYFSEGQLLFRCDVQVLTNCLRHLETHYTGADFDYKYEQSEILILEPDFSVDKSAWQFLFTDQARKYDTFILYFPLEASLLGAGGSATTFSPFTENPAYYERCYRGKISIRSVYMDSYFTLVHEFFHLVEVEYNYVHPFMAHLFRKFYRSRWPSWYHGEGEWTYYREIFQRVVIPNKLANFVLRDDKATSK